jgi:hypothetical protein
MDRYDEHREHIYEVVERDMTNLFEAWSKMVDSGETSQAIVYAAISDQYGSDLAFDWLSAHEGRL